MVTDLQLYVVYLTQEQRNEVLETLQKYITENKKDPVRSMKATISLNKFKLMFSSKSATSEELQSNLKELTAQYLDFITLDDKPAKGERKFADEQVLLISETIDQAENSQSLNLDVFKVCLLEFAYEQSNYNFDI